MALWAISIVLVVARFIFLRADFPPGITTSGALYTDEGWYTNAAARHYMTGEWYRPGDVNPAVNLPFGQLLVRFVFAVAGLGIGPARLATALSFVLLAGLLAVIVRRHFGPGQAALAVLLLSSNYVAFAYSRLAVMDLIAPVIVLASLTVAGSRAWAPALVWLTSSALLVMAILTKTTSFFALPLLGYVIALRQQGLVRRCLAVAGIMLFTAALVGAYTLLARAAYPEDYDHFMHVTFAVRALRSLADILMAIPRRIASTFVLGGPLVIVGAVAIPSALVISKTYRCNPLVHILLGWYALYVLELSLSSYSPDRYHLAQLIPLTALSASACVELAARSQRKVAHLFVVALILSIVAQDTVRIVAYLRAPEYSFVNMARDIAQIVRAREGDPADATLLGNMADSVALETGVRSVNSRLGTRDLPWKIATYRPNYLLIHTDSEVLDYAVAKCQVGLLGSWEVYHNYYDQGQSVRLFSLDCGPWAAHLTR